jgi:hypothetical protein
MKEKIEDERLSAAKQGRFVRFPYGTFVILLVDSIIHYRFTSKPKTVIIAQQSFIFFTKRKTNKTNKYIR